MITNCPSKIQRYRNEYGFKANSKYFVKRSNHDLEQNKFCLNVQISFLFYSFFFLIIHSHCTSLETYSCDILNGSES